jgi:S-(hydroxymethyl)glutathione dehydrogenase / alcohol dehydrogenase
MKAAVLRRPGDPLRIEEVTLAAPREGEVEVKLAATGVCRSDLHVMTGATRHPLPVVCGHEGSGRVSAVGPGVTRVSPGDPVVLSWSPMCGACFYCTHDLPAQCEAYLEAVWNGTMRDGTTRLSASGEPIYHYAALASFAEACVVPESCCIPIPREAPLQTAALIGCAVATGVGAALIRAHVPQGAFVAVFGCGGVGMNILQGARLCGASRIIAVDVNPARLDAAPRFGATHMVNATSGDPVTSVRALTDGRGADFTFEALGRPAVMQQAMDAARRGGTVVLVGLGGQDEEVHLGAGTFTRSDKTLTSAYYGGIDPSRDIPRLVDLSMQGKLQLDPLVGRRRPLDEINEAIEDLKRGEVLRTLITFG